eukprot:m51a1_g10844 hypothetical protein (275) ;mRNA; f:32594-33484
MQLTPHGRSYNGRCTRDDLILAAFQGPVLGLSSPVVHQFRTFTAELLVRPAWLASHGLSPSDAARSVLSARACRPPPFTSPDPLVCPKCGPVLNVRLVGTGVNSGDWDAPAQAPAPAQGTEEQLPGGLECFRVELRTRCTSSRQHLGCPTLVLAVVLGPGLVVRSEPFAVYARHAARHLRKRRRSSAPDDSEGESPPAPAAAAAAAGDAGAAVLAAGEVVPRPLASPMTVAVKIVASRLRYDEAVRLDRGILSLLTERLCGGFLLKKKTTLAGA